MVGAGQPLWPVAMAYNDNSSDLVVLASHERNAAGLCWAFVESVFQTSR